MIGRVERGKISTHCGQPCACTLTPVKLLYCTDPASNRLTGAAGQRAVQLDPSKHSADRTERSYDRPAPRRDVPTANTDTLATLSSLLVVTSAPTVVRRQHASCPRHNNAYAAIARYGLCCIQQVVKQARSLPCDAEHPRVPTVPQYAHVRRATSCCALDGASVLSPSNCTQRLPAERIRQRRH